MENEFSANSYGFRANKNARQAVGSALEHIHEGYTHIVDIDLKSFFDEVDHLSASQSDLPKGKMPENT